MFEQQQRGFLAWKIQLAFVCLGLKALRAPYTTDNSWLLNDMRVPYPSFAAHASSWMKVVQWPKELLPTIPVLETHWKCFPGSSLVSTWLTLNPQFLISIFPLVEGSTRYMLSWVDRLNLKAQGYPKSILGYCAENYP